MKYEHFGLGAAALALALHMPAVAQDTDVADTAQDAVVEAAADAMEEAPAMEKAVMAAPFASRTEGSCELHIWPTENYLGVKMGLLSGFGLVGALADQAANKNKVTTVKDLMREYLGPEVQMEELEKLDPHGKLGLSDE